MSDAFATTIERLNQTKGDPQAQSAIAAEFALEVRPEPERSGLRAALDAAAVLHWFDASLLAKMLEVPEADAQERFKVLAEFPFVEPFRSGGVGLRNVHESTRFGWRRQLAASAPGEFARLSARASAIFADDRTPTGRIEWIYHLLCGDPERGATGLENLDREWSASAHPETRYALAATLRELEETRLVQGRARLWVLLVLAWVRVIRGEAARLSDDAVMILELARGASDSRAEAEAQCLLGDVREAQGKLEGARAAFGEYLAISRRLAEQDPSNAGWQRGLAAAHNRVGGVLEARGKLEEARAAFGETLAIFRRLVEQDPSNSDWQRNLAAAHGRLGEVLQAQGKLGEARGALREQTRIVRRLVAWDPSNAEWKHLLAQACSTLALLEIRLGRPPAARSLAEEASRMYADLARIAPDFAAWNQERSGVEEMVTYLRQLGAKNKPKPKPGRMLPPRQSEPPAASMAG